MTEGNAAVQQPQTIKMFQVPENVFNAVANYLATKPYQEVNQLLTAVMTSTRLVEVPLAPAEAPKAAA